MPYEQGLQQVDRAYEKISEASKLMVDALLNSFLFTWKWWIGLGILVIPWILWFLFSRKESSDRLLYAGFVTIILSSILDLTGISQGK